MSLTQCVFGVGQRTGVQDNWDWLLKAFCYSNSVAFGIQSEILIQRPSSGTRSFCVRCVCLTHLYIVIFLIPINRTAFEPQLYNQACFPFILSGTRRFRPLYSQVITAVMEAKNQTQAAYSVKRWHFSMKAYFSLTFLQSTPRPFLKISRSSVTRLSSCLRALLHAEGHRPACAAVRFFIHA